MLKLLILLVFCNFALGQFAPFAIWTDRQQTLTFATSPQTIYNAICSSPVTVRTTYGGSSPKPVTSDLTVTLSVTAGFTYYSDENCLNPITDLVITNGNYAGNYYFMYSGTGTVTMAASAAGWESADQDATFTSNPYIWTGGGSPSTSWSTGANWSGAAAPGINDIAVFNNLCVSNCDPDILTAVDVSGIRIDSTYSGTLTQGAVNIILGTGSFIQSGGTFSGTTNVLNKIEVQNGNFVIAGGTFVAPAGETRVSNSWQVLNFPTVTFPADSKLVAFCSLTAWKCYNTDISFHPGSVSYENLTIYGYSSDYYFGGATMVVNKEFRVGDAHGNLPTINNGTIHLYGDLTQSAGSTEPRNFKVVLKGNASGQTITGNSYLGPNIELDTGLNAVTLAGEYRLTSWEVTSVGTFTATGSTLRFHCGAAGQMCFQNPFTIAPGAVTYDNIQISGYRNDIDLGGATWNVDGNFIAYTASGNREFANGTVLIKGDLSGGGGYRGSGLFKLIGNASGQTLTGSGGFFPNLEIDTGANNVTLAGLIVVENSFTVTSVGALTTAGSTVQFLCNSSARPCFSTNFIFTHSNHSFDNLLITGYRTTLDLGASTLKLTGDLNISATAGSWNDLQNGTIEIGGNFGSNGDSVLGTAQLTFNGTGPQTLSNAGNSLPDGTITVDKSSGTLTFMHDVTLDGTGQDFVITNGSVDMAGFAFTIDDVLTIDTGATLTQNGGALTYGSIVNNGTLNP